MVTLTAAANGAEQRSEGSGREGSLRSDRRESRRRKATCLPAKGDRPLVAVLLRRHSPIRALLFLLHPRLSSLSRFAIVPARCCPIARLATGPRAVSAGVQESRAEHPRAWSRNLATADGAQLRVAGAVAVQPADAAPERCSRGVLADHSARAAIRSALHASPPIDLATRAVTVRPLLLTSWPSSAPVVAHGTACAPPHPPLHAHCSPRDHGPGSG